MSPHPYDVDTSVYDEKVRSWEHTQYRNEFKAPTEQALGALFDPELMVSIRSRHPLQRVFVGWAPECPGVAAGAEGRLLRLYINGPDDQPVLFLVRDANDGDRRQYDEQPAR